MRVSAMVVLCGILGGCAWTEDVVDVEYTPGVATPIAASARPVTLVVTDGRTEDRLRISTKTNGYGCEMGAVRSSRSVTDIVRDALSSELKARGLGVDSSGAPVSIVVRRFYSQYHMMWVEGEVILDVTLSDEKKNVLFSRTYTGKSRSTAMMFNGTNAAEAVAAALKDAIAGMFDDQRFVDALTEKRLTLRLPVRDPTAGT